uniref:Uncharacterized protein n=1 Tax=Moniliophthora roreri TaxID=221103 RepID=A0A0W0FTZ8_MONRR
MYLGNCGANTTLRPRRRVCQGASSMTEFKGSHQTQYGAPKQPLVSDERLVLWSASPEFDETHQLNLQPNPHEHLQRCRLASETARTMNALFFIFAEAIDGYIQDFGGRKAEGEGGRRAEDRVLKFLQPCIISGDECPLQWHPSTQNRSISQVQNPSRKRRTRLTSKNPSQSALLALQNPTRIQTNADRRIPLHVDDVHPQRPNFHH